MKSKHKPNIYLELNNLNLEGLVLENLNITKIDFRDSNLNYSDFNKVNSDEGTLFGGASLKYSDINGVFNEANFYRANMANSVFTGDYEDCLFGESNLYGAEFEGGKFINVGFWNSNMTNTFFESEISIINSNFEGAILKCADMRMLKISTDLLKGVIKNDETYLPE